MVEKKPKKTRVVKVGKTSGRLTESAARKAVKKVISKRGKMKEHEEKLPQEVKDFYDRMLLHPPPMTSMLLGFYKGHVRLDTSPDSIDEDGLDPPKGKIEPPEWTEIEGEME